LQLPVGAGGKVFDQFAAMDRRSVPDNQQRRLHVAQERSEKLDDLRAFDRTGVNLKIEIPQHDARDDRKTLPTESLVNDRRLATRRPSPNPVRTRAQAAFVDEDDGAPLSLGIFFKAGQV